ncbi:MAG: hypothetical protein E7813_25345 [Bradyrhizobium sp.]|nr:MAG: hypothetical protein E7813_25345 [Bradyrhizobium sp.]
MEYPQHLFRRDIEAAIDALVGESICRAIIRERCVAKQQTRKRYARHEHQPQASEGGVASLSHAEPAFDPQISDIFSNIRNKQLTKGRLRTTSLGLRTNELIAGSEQKLRKIDG